MTTLTVKLPKNVVKAQAKALVGIPSAGFVRATQQHKDRRRADKLGIVKHKNRQYD